MYIYVYVKRERGRERERERGRERERENPVELGLLLVLRMCKLMEPLVKLSYEFTQPLFVEYYATVGQFLSRVYRFEFRVFLFLDRLLFQS